jgi:hypothetical protein
MDTLIIIKKIFFDKKINGVTPFSKSGTDVWFTVYFDGGGGDNISMDDIQTYYSGHQIECDNAEKQDALIKLQGQLLTQFQPLLSAINSQYTGKQLNPNTVNIIFTDEQMSEWLEYIGSIAKDGFDVSQFDLEQITPIIFGPMPELPIAYANLIK